MTARERTPQAGELFDRSGAAVPERDLPSGAAKLVGFVVTSVEPGRAVVELEAGERHLNLLGTVHGGVLCTIADTAMGVAHGSTLPEGELATTLELKINFLRPARTGRLRAIGKLVKSGRTTALVECDVVDEQENLVARASSTYMTLRNERAGER